MKIAESKRIKIRELEDGDGEELSRLCENVETKKLANISMSLENMSAEKILKIFSASSAVYVIETNEKRSKVLGFIFVRKFEDFKLKNYQNPLHINCIINPIYRGKGYGRESIYAFMTYSFQKDESAIFVSKAKLSNVASIRIMNRYMQSIPRSKKTEHDFVYFASNATIFFSKLEQQERG